jgi:Gram-negative bacterial TonB protein C-terminal
MKFASLLITALLAASQLTVNAQTVSSDASGQVVLIDLSTPTYPPTARLAHITGDETVLVMVRPDGTVESAVVESSGPALLVMRQAAVDSASKSNFQCRNCKETMAYRIVYAFKLAESADPCNTQTMPPRVEHHPEGPAQSHVNIEVEQIWTCDPVTKRVRSLKCFYLWKCGSS